MQWSHYVHNRTLLGAKNTVLLDIAAVVGPVINNERLGEKSFSLAINLAMVVVKNHKLLWSCYMTFSSSSM